MPHAVFVDMKPYVLPALEAARALGCDVTLVRSRVNAAGSANADQRTDEVIGIDDPCYGNELAETLTALHRRHPVDALIAVHDEVVGALAPIAAELGIRFTDPLGVRRARDKALCRQTLAQAGFTEVDHLTLRSADELAAAAQRLGYPFVVKLAAGMASIAASIVREPEDVKAAAEKIRLALDRMAPEHVRAIGTTLIAERYLEGPLLSVELASVEGWHTPLAVLERQQYGQDRTMELGSIAPPRLSSPQLTAVREYAMAAADILGLDTGVFHIEMIHTADGPVLIDPNPRLVGGPNPLLINHCWDIDVYTRLLTVHLGRRQESVPVVPSRSGAAHVLAPTADGRRSDTDLSWLDREPGVVNWSLRLGVGETARRATSNFHYLGHVLALGDTCAQAADTAIHAVGRLADEIGIPLMRWKPLTEEVIV